MTTITVAALQLAFTDSVEENIAAVSALVREAAGAGAKLILPPELFESYYFCRTHDERHFARALPVERHPAVRAMQALVREAAGAGAKLILPPELFESHYFCRTHDERHFARALPVERHPAVRAMQALAAELRVFIPTSFFEAAGHHHYNSLAMIDDEGAVMGVYRKSHIPDGPGYSEKFYFRPGNTGFKTFATPFGTIGPAVCWDQWYPETARALMLEGAEILLFPTAIGTEPHDPELDTSRMWRRAMIGHAVSNVVPVVAANRIGVEGDQRFYGHSFICDERGDILGEFGAQETGVLVATLDLEQARAHRAAFGFFRDRRPDLYGRISRDL